LSLCLTKNHAMKMHPALDKTLGRENLWWSGGTAPHLLNLDTR